MLSPHELVKEVATLLEQGNICYVKKEEREIIQFALSEMSTPENMLLVNAIEEKIKSYIKCEPIPNNKMVWIMQSFVKEMTNDEVRKELYSALNRKKPIRNFLQIVDNHFDIKMHWTLFKAEQYEAYVSELFINDYNY